MSEVNEMFKRILVAIDASDYSRLIIPATIEVARKFGSSVFVLHVVEHDRGRAVTFSVESRAEAAELVAKSVKAIRTAGVDADGRVSDVAVGHVANDIVGAATAHESDLIVMGSRGLSDVQGLLLGSVTHKVMHLAQVPVLVVRGPIPVTEKAEPAFKRMAVARA